MCSLDSLTSLHVWNNKLASLPERFGDLRWLNHFKANGNDLAALPMSFGALNEHLDYAVSDNPLQQPPFSIAQQGVAAVRTYFEQLRRHETVVSRWAKLVLVGDGEVGKTSLLRLLQWRRAAPTDASERTVQLDLTVLGVGESSPSEELGTGAAAALFSCWDLSGQPEYAPAQQPFLTAGPLFMLAVPAHRANDENYAAVLGRWLDVLQVGAPGALVQPLITQADRLLSETQREAAVTRRVFRTTAACAAGLPSALKSKSGKFFYEVTIESMGTACAIGWATPDFEATIVSTWAPSAVHLGREAGKSEVGDSWVLNCMNGQLRRSSREFQTAYQQSKPELCQYVAGDVIGVAIDIEQGLIYFARNDVWFNGFEGDDLKAALAQGVFPAFEGVGCSLCINMGAQPFVHGPPDARYYEAIAPDAPIGFCEQLRGKQQAFHLTALWNPEVLDEAAKDAVSWRIIPVVSAVPGGELTARRVTDQLEAIACATPPLLPSIGFSIPSIWLPAMAFLRALRDGLDPSESVRRAFEGEPPLNPISDGVPDRRRPYAQVDTLRVEWEDEMVLNWTFSTQSGRLNVPPSAQTVEDALKLLADQGEMFVSSGIAYLDPAYVTALVKPLVDHRLSSRVFALQFAKHGAHATELLAAVDTLVACGELREGLLPLLWKDTGLSDADYDQVLEMLADAGVLFEVQNAVIEDHLELAEAGELVLRARFDLGSFVPPGLVERLMAASYSLGAYHHFWRRGALLRVQLKEDGKHDAKRLGKLILEVRGGTLDRPTSAPSNTPSPLPGSAPFGSGAEGGAIVPTEEELRDQGGYALHFEAFGPHECKAALGSLMARARALTDLLLRDFPGMIASPMTAVAAPPAGIW